MILRAIFVILLSILTIWEVFANEATTHLEPPKPTQIPERFQAPSGQLKERPSSVSSFLFGAGLGAIVAGVGATLGYQKKENEAVKKVNEANDLIRKLKQPKPPMHPHLKKFLSALPKVAAASIPVVILGHTYTSLQRQRHAEMIFLSINNGTVWHCGSVVEIQVQAKRFISSVPIYSSILTLMDQYGHIIRKIMHKKTSNFLKAKPDTDISIGKFLWKIPPATHGIFRLQYDQSIWNVALTHMASSSPLFEIQCNGDIPVLTSTVAASLVEETQAAQGKIENEEVHSNDSVSDDTK